MINIAICDDNELMLYELSEMINTFFKAEQIDTTILTFFSGEELLTSHNLFDIIFLDIQIDGLNGMDVAKLLRYEQYNGFIIFVTILEELVFHSFEVQAFDYLVKPIEPIRFQQTMKRLLSFLVNNSNTSLCVQKGYECRIIPFDDIVYCEIINRKIYLHLAQSEIVDYYDKIENLEKKLDKRFFKCHRSFLVNLKYVRSLQKGVAYLSNGETIPVSRLRNEDFSNIILHYMKDWRHLK